MLSAFVLEVNSIMIKLKSAILVVMMKRIIEDGDGDVF